MLAVVKVEYLAVCWVRWLVALKVFEKVDSMAAGWVLLSAVKLVDTWVGRLVGKSELRMVEWMAVQLVKTMAVPWAAQLGYCLAEYSAA